MAKTITYTELCELLGRAVREQWNDLRLLDAFKELIRDAWGEKAVLDGHLTVSISSRTLAYSGYGPGMYAHVKPDGSMFTPEEVASIAMK